jgi:predicted transposase/invertase (TIGR01784 family)
MRITGERNIYAGKQVQIPAPEFIVLYNGTAAYPDVTILKLSDSFANAPLGLNKKPELELYVKVYNINKGHNEAIIQRSERLNGYSTFIAKVREYEAQDAAREDALKAAAKWCITHNILKDFLKLHSSEVINMLLTEWNWDTALEVRWEEGVEEGREEGIQNTAKNALAKGLPLDTICDITGLDLETIKKLASEQA